jgi:uncharacterized protein YceH (UPF0502 family)
MPDLTANPPPSEPSSKWRALPAIDRRILGVLIEKGKTTPDQYPMSLNALTAGCNQKSNRYPQMELDPEDVLKSVDRLRMLGAVAEVQGGGRVPRFRHFAYEWLGVNKVELAVMAELLLRGSQTEGELRGRAARMEPIADVTALRPVLESLVNKRLVVSLTSPGRGHMVTHNLYEPQEMEKQRALHGGGEGGETDWERGRLGEGETSRAAVFAATEHAHSPGVGASAQRAAGETASSLHEELQSLRSEIAQLKNELAELVAAHQRTTDELRSVRDALGG